MTVSPNWLWWVLSATAVAFLLFTLVLKLANRKVRQAILGVMPTQVEFAPIDPEQVARLHKQELLERTADLEALGFQRLRDYTADRPGKSGPPGFARLFVNRAEYCFAEIMATSEQLRKAKPLTVAISSFLENDWDLGTSNVVPSRGHHFMLLPKVMRMHYPGAVPKELFDRHLARRKEILEGLGIKLRTNLSIESYFGHLQKRMAERRESMQKRQPIDELPTADALVAIGKYEWLGEFPKERDRLRGAAVKTPGKS